MFYSHEVLTSRKYGVATVWLVATLGSKSNLKKVSRKAILDVDVAKACETIVTPDAPMALRLQSNLLYGVTRVYAQQCGYVLTDAEAARNSMRAMVKAMRTSALDEQGHKGRADQLVLQDDPNFLPDIDFAAVDLDRLDFDATSLLDDSQRSTLSPHGSQQAGLGIGSQQDIGGLIIPQSASSFIAGPVGGFGGLSAHGSARRDVDQGGLFDDDLGLIVGDDGALLDDLPMRQSTAIPSRGERTDVSGMSSKVRRDVNQGQQGQEMLSQPDGDGFMPLQDDYMFGSDAQPYPPPAEEDAQQPQQETSEETADAPMRRRARPAQKIIPLDANMELHNRDLARWNTEYLANMAQALRQKNAGKAASQAKKNAEFWMLGYTNTGPLSLFQGSQLLEALTGVKLGEKRPRDEGYVSAEETRRKRSRTGEPSDEIARGIDYDDGFMPMPGDEDTIEQGREAPTPLDDDRHLSSLMPWNQSAGSRRPTALFSGQQQHLTSASMGQGGGLQLSLPARRGSRLTSASPLQGRGAPPVDVDDFQLPMDSQGDIGMTGTADEDFELYGPAAAVDTQTAAQSQWQRAVLDSESVNFLSFVKAGIAEREEAGQGSDVEFAGLLPPRANTCVVAAQALLHVLSLGTKGLLEVGQEEAFGAITLREPMERI